MIKTEGRVYFLPRVSMRELDAYLSRVADLQTLKVIRDFVVNCVDQHKKVVERIDEEIAARPKAK